MAASGEKAARESLLRLRLLVKERQRFIARERPVNHSDKLRPGVSSFHESHYSGEVLAELGVADLFGQPLKQFVFQSPGIVSSNQLFQSLLDAGSKAIIDHIICEGFSALA